MFNKRKKFYNHIVLVILLMYIGLLAEIFLFFGASWGNIMNFYFMPPYTGFNIYRIDIKLEWK